MSCILVVCDNSDMRDFCYEVLAREGHSISTVPASKDAVSIFDKSHRLAPDLILFGVSLPASDIFKLIGHYRRASKAVPIVVLSETVTADIEKDIFTAGATEIIRRSVGPDNLKDRLRLFLKKQPVDPAPSSLEDAGRAASVAISRNNKVLIVDDEEEIRDFLKGFLTEKRYYPLVARSGEEAIEIVRREEPRVVLLDIVMPGMDGLLTLRRLRDMDPDMGIVIATGVQDERLAREAVMMGAYDYVLKPFDLSYLELVVLTRLSLAA